MLPRLGSPSRLRSWSCFRRWCGCDSERVPQPTGAPPDLVWDIPLLPSSQPVPVPPAPAQALPSPSLLAPVLEPPVSDPPMGAPVPSATSNMQELAAACDRGAAAQACKQWAHLPAFPKGMCTGCHNQSHLDHLPAQQDSMALTLMAPEETVFLAAKSSSESLWWSSGACKNSDKSSAQHLCSCQQARPLHLP